MKTKFFTVDKLFDNVTRIGGLAGELCYLVEGREKALLIDGLTGVGSLKALVRELTDLPVEILNTHGHVDHCGADFEYRQAYIHPADIALLYRHGDEEMRRGFAASGGAEVRLEDVVPLCNVRTLPIADGRAAGGHRRAGAHPGHRGAAGPGPAHRLLRGRLQRQHPGGGPRLPQHRGVPGEPGAL